MTTRRWFEFVSATTLRVLSLPTSLGSAYRHLPLSLPSSLSPLHSLSRFARFFLRRSIPQPASSSSLVSFLTLGERVLSALFLSLPLPSLAFPSSQRLVLSRQPHRFTFYVPPAVSLALSLSFHLSLSAPRINPSPSRAPYLLSRTGSPVLPLALSSAMAPLAGPLSVESLCARQAGHRGKGRGSGGRRGERRKRRRRVHVPSRSTERNWYIGG